MTDKDKTGDQLVASIRKTKSSAAASKKTAVRRAPAKAKTSPAKAVVPKEEPAVRTNNYQSAGRVWPD